MRSQKAEWGLLGGRRADDGAGLEKQLLEMYRNRSLQPGEPGELLGAVHASLRRKVQGLDADNWMFEAEGRTIGEG